MTATATSSSEDERGQQMGEGGETLEGEGGEALEGEGGEGSRATEGVPLPGLPMSEVPRASLRFRFLTTASDSAYGKEVSKYRCYHNYFIRYVGNHKRN